MSDFVHNPVPQVVVVQDLDKGGVKSQEIVNSDMDHRTEEQTKEALVLAAKHQTEAQKLIEKHQEENLKLTEPKEEKTTPKANVTVKKAPTAVAVKKK